MERFVRTMFVSVLLAAMLSAACGFAQSAAPIVSTVKQNVSGKWSGSFDMTAPDGSIQHDTAVLILKQDGSAVTGSVGQSEDKQTEITDGKADGPQIQFTMDTHRGMSMIFHLRMESDHLKGDADGETPGGKVSAKVDAIRVSGHVSPPPSPSQELFDEVSHMDSILFTAFNRRDLDKLKTLFTEDLEFYHDLGGLTSYQQTMDSFKRTFEGSITVRRELVEGTLEVYPIKDYGAVEIGVHRFYSTDTGQKEKLTATAKFVHVWQKKNGEWKISRVVSYDHR
jgi:ketosteroid isomerase-like protein